GEPSTLTSGDGSPRRRGPSKRAIAPGTLAEVQRTVRIARQRSARVGAEILARADVLEAPAIVDRALVALLVALDDAVAAPGGRRRRRRRRRSRSVDRRWRGAWRRR